MRRDTHFQSFTLADSLVNKPTMRFSSIYKPRGYDMVWAQTHPLLLMRPDPASAFIRSAPEQMRYADSNLYEK